MSSIEFPQKSFSVILNGCSTPDIYQNTGNIRKKLGISNDDYLYIFVGNVGARKNQIQVVDALKILVEQGRKDIKCAFLGGGDHDNLKEIIKEYKLEGLAFVLGFVQKSSLPEFFLTADATILTSVSEGFGLSIIEGFSYGIPNLTFGDLPAVKDIYSADAMLLCSDRKTETLALCMIKMTETKWDRNKILAWANNFSFESMANKYIHFYKNVLCKQ